MKKALFIGIPLLITIIIGWLLFRKKPASAGATSNNGDGTASATGNSLHPRLQKVPAYKIYSPKRVNGDNRLFIEGNKHIGLSLGDALESGIDGLDRYIRYKVLASDTLEDLGITYATTGDWDRRDFEFILKGFTPKAD